MTKPPHSPIQKIPKGNVRIFERLNTIASAHQFHSKRETISNRIEALSLSDQNKKHAFWIGAWTDCWVLCFPGPKHFKIPDESTIEDVFQSALIESKNQNAWTATIESGVIEMTQLQWSHMLFEHERLYFAQSGWHELKDAEVQTAWSRFQKIFVNGKIVGLPWVTWDIKHFAQLSHPEQLRLDRDLQTKLLSAMCRSGTDDWYALDFNHPCYAFRPMRLTERITTGLSPF